MRNWALFSLYVEALPVYYYFYVKSLPPFLSRRCLETKRGRTLWGGGGRGGDLKWARDSSKGGTFLFGTTLHATVHYTTVYTVVQYSMSGAHTGKQAPKGELHYYSTVGRREKVLHEALWWEYRGGRCRKEPKARAGYLHTCRIFFGGGTRSYCDGILRWCT